MKRLILICAALFLAAFAGLYVGAIVRGRSESRITVSNATTGLLIEEAVVVVCDKVFRLHNITANDSRRVAYSMTGADCHYDVIARFTNGTIVAESGGYITPGFDYETAVRIRSDSIQIEIQIAR